MDSNLTKVTLSEITIDGKGSYGIPASAVDKDSNLYTYLRITDISEDGTLIREGLKSVDDPKASNYILKKNDIVFARTGNSTGKSYFHKNDEVLVYAGFLIKFSLNEEKVNPNFIRYYTLSDEYKGWVKSFSTGSTRGNINAKTFGNMEIELPPRAKQDFAVKVLDPIEEKIESNNAIILNLEEIVKQIFQKWFVDYDFPNEKNLPYRTSGGEMINSEIGMIPEGWYISSIKDITEKFTTGLNPRKNFTLGNGYNYYVTIKNMGNNNIFLDDKCDKIDDEALKIINKRSDLRKGDILFSGIGTIGRVYLVPENPTNWNISESIFTLRPNNKISSEYLYQLFLSEGVQSYSKALASGSVQKGIRKADLENYNFALSNNCIEEKFTNLIKPFIFMIQEFNKENLYLKNLRDTLIPKFLKGEIEIPDEGVVES